MIGSHHRLAQAATLTGSDETPVRRGERVPSEPVVSVCIPVVSNHGLIEGCLDSLADSRPSVDTEVVVVANGLAADGLSSLQKRDDIVLVFSAVNTGFSGGNNLAARDCPGPLLAASQRRQPRGGRLHRSTCCRSSRGTL